MGLSLTGRHWQLPQAPGAPRTSDAVGLSELSRLLLERRGVAGDDEVRSFLAPTLKSLHDPGPMADMGPAVDCLIAALAARERIVVYGDYDVDGVCSTALLVEFLRALGGVVEFYIPDRQSEGYGLNEAAVRRIADGGKVLITTDTGISAHHELEVAKALGLRVIVVDHHKVPEVLPPAVACLNPHRPDCAFPFKDLCATGVAFMLVVALRRRLRDQGFFSTHPEPDVRDLLDLVAVATVADMVPLQGQNRLLVRAGLQRLAQRQRPGLAALCAVAGLEEGPVSSIDVAFRIAPRINARGRLSHAREAVELMLTADRGQANAFAQILDAMNTERRQIEQETVRVALERVQGLADIPAGLVMFDPSWHPGVLGLVASRLVSTCQRPAVVIGQGGKGSARSVEGLDLCAAIGAGGAHLIRFGGHPAAAGLTIDPDSPEKISAFSAAFAEAVHATLGPPPYAASLRPDLEITTQTLSLDLVREVEQLGPFGQGHPEPLFMSRHLGVEERRVVGGTHLKLRLGGLEAIAFGLGRLADSLPDEVDALFRLERNVFRGRESLQLRVEDMRPASEVGPADL